MTWYMNSAFIVTGRRENEGGHYARPRGIRGTQAKPLPLLPSGPGGVCSRPLHGARGLTSHDFSMYAFQEHAQNGARPATARFCIPVLHSDAGSCPLRFLSNTRKTE